MNRDIFVNLRNILTKLYPDELSIRRIIDESGVDSSRIDLRSTTINSWHAVLTEAEKTNQVNILRNVSRIVRQKIKKK